LLVSTITNFVTDKNIYLDYFCKRSIEDIIVFDGLSVDELEQAFKTVIEQYLTDCQTLNKNPNQPTYSLSSHGR
jgi:predicted HicB family RNase H-like nuclease